MVPKETAVTDSETTRKKPRGLQSHGRRAVPFPSLLPLGFSQKRSSKDWCLSVWGLIVVLYCSRSPRPSSSTTVVSTGGHPRWLPTWISNKSKWTEEGKERNSTGTQTQTWPSYGKSLKVPEVDQQSELGPQSEVLGVDTDSLILRLHLGQARVFA